jgi:hypothetical protein
MSIRAEIKMQRAVNRLSKYYGLLTSRDLANTIAAAGRTGNLDALSNPTPESPAIPTASEINTEDLILGDIINDLIDVGVGCFTTKQLLERFAQKLGILGSSSEDAATLESLRRRYGELIQIASDAQYHDELPFAEGFANLQNASIRELISDTDPGLLATGATEPTKDNPGLSVIISQTNRISVTNRFSNACSLFLNSIPSIEISKAMPYMEVNILIPLQSVQRSGDRLIAPTIYKFLLGGTNAAPGSVLEQLSLANEERRTIDPATDRAGNTVETVDTSGATIRTENIYTTVGMEAFLMPQTLVNPDAANNINNFGNIVLDKFRPFLSIDDMSFTEQSSFSAYGYQTAKMSLTLHDRSRLNEIAEFVRADVRGRTEIVIEWGWIHTESENNTNPNNIWADIINGMRKRLKFQVTNSSFNFEEGGQVKINLDLATMGEVAGTTEPCINDVNIRPILDQINLLVETVGRISINNPILNPPTSTTTTGGTTSGTASSGTSRPTGSPEIRGIQFLNQIQDFYSNLTLTRERREELNQLTRSLAALPQTDDIRRLRFLITELYGNAGSSSGSRRGTGRTGGLPATELLRRQMQNEIRRKLSQLKKGLNDPFLVGTYNPHVDRRNRMRNTGGWPRSRSAIENDINTISTSGSLATAEAERLRTEAAALRTEGDEIIRADIAEQNAELRASEAARRRRALRTAVGPIGEPGERAARAGAAIAESYTRPPTESATVPSDFAIARSDLNERVAYNLEREAESFDAAATSLGRRERLLETERANYSTRLSEALSRAATASPVPRGAVSLANILLTFMGQPFAATGQFDDVQLVFYPFNEYAGFASRINVANFIINIEDFQTKYVEYRLQTINRSGTFTIRQFWTFLTSQIIDDPAQDSYGLVDGRGALYRRPTTESDSGDSSSSRSSTTSVPVDSDGAAYTTRLNNLLRDVTPDGSFRIPQLQYSLECLPGRPSSEGDIESLQIEKTILRIHIFDQQATAYEGLGSILRAQRAAQLSVPTSRTESGGTETNPDPSLVRRNAILQYQQTLAQAERNGLIARMSSGDGGTSQYEIVGGPESIKRFLYQTTPYIIHGAQNSLIKTANLSTITDQAANTLALVRTPDGSGLLRPDGQDAGNLPMQILPVELSMDILGCPLIGYASQFFIDFNTNTTADALYMVNGIEHKVTAGDFSTTIRFVQQSNYGEYRNYIQDLQTAAARLETIERSITGTDPEPIPPPSPPPRRRTRRTRVATATTPPTTAADATARFVVSPLGWNTSPTTAALMAAGAIPVPGAESLAVPPDTPRAPEIDPERAATAAATEIEREAVAARETAVRAARDAEREIAEARGLATGRVPAAAPSTPGGLTPATPATPSAPPRPPFTTLRGGSGGF